MFRSFLLLFILFYAADLSAQKQLLILKKEKVLLRLNYGDPIVFRLKGDPQIKRSYINNVYDTAFKVHLDTIPFRKIDRIYFKQSLPTNVIGGLAVTAGAGYFAIDQLNEMAVQGNDFSLDQGVTRTAVVLVGVGLPMMLIKKKSQKIRYPVRLLMAKKGSPFYVPPRNESSFIDIPEN